MFAVPVIVMSDKPTGPLEATRKSVNIVKKAWGESAVSQIGLGLIQILYTIGWTALMAAIIAGYAFIAPTEEYDIAFGGTLIGLFIIGMVVISVIFSALSSIAKAATYHYATTGESPEMFNKQLMREAMTAKKASKIFAQ